MAGSRARDAAARLRRGKAQRRPRARRVLDDGRAAGRSPRGGQPEPSHGVRPAARGVAALRAEGGLHVPRIAGPEVSGEQPQQSAEHAVRRSPGDRPRMAQAGASAQLGPRLVEGLRQALRLGQHHRPARAARAGSSGAAEERPVRGGKPAWTIPPTRAASAAPPAGQDQGLVGIEWAHVLEMPAPGRRGRRFGRAGGPGVGRSCACGRATTLSSWGVERRACHRRPAPTPSRRRGRSASRPRRQRPAEARRQRALLARAALGPDRRQTALLRASRPHGPATGRRRRCGDRDRRRTKDRLISGKLRAKAGAPVRRPPSSPWTGSATRWTYRHGWIVWGKGIKALSISVSLHPERTRELILDLTLKVGAEESLPSEARVARALLAGIKVGSRGRMGPGVSGPRVSLRDRRASLGRGPRNPARPGLGLGDGEDGPADGPAGAGAGRHNPRLSRRATFAERRMGTEAKP